MRLAERLTRLETRAGNHDRVTGAEIDAAADRFAGDLTLKGVPSGKSVAEELLVWRRIVENSPPWAQRVFLNAHPEDLYV